MNEHKYLFFASEVASLLKVSPYTHHVDTFDKLVCRVFKKTPHSTKHNCGLQPRTTHTPSLPAVLTGRVVFSTSASHDTTSLSTTPSFTTPLPKPTNIVENIVQHHMGTVYSNKPVPLATINKCIEDIKQNVVGEDNRQHGVKLARTTAGEMNEAVALDQYDQLFDCTVDRSQCFHDVAVHIHNCTFYIGGRLDGLLPTHVIEVKNRQRRYRSISRNIPKHEMLQLVCYINIYNRPCHFVQFADNAFSVMLINNNSALWQYVCRQLYCYCQLLHEFQNTTTLAAWDAMDITTRCHFLDNYIASVLPPDPNARPVHR